MAGDLLTQDLIFYDPLSETTRKERTALLGLSMLGVALVKVPLVPEKFSALGIDFTNVNQHMFVRLYALLVFYYLVAFSIYATTDYIAWRRREVINLREYEFQVSQRSPPATQDLNAMLPMDRKPSVKIAPANGPAYVGAASFWLGFRAARVRAMFEFLLPVGFAAYTLYALKNYVPTL